MKKIYFRTLILLVVAILFALLIQLDFSNAKLLLIELRVPRVIAAIAVGAALALSGLVMQTVLANPLAEPYTLGIASGAALGAAISTSLGIKIHLFGLNVGAVVGALMVLFLLLKWVMKGSRRSESIILLGVMMSLTCASLLAIWMALADPLGVQSITFWLLGDLSRVDLYSGLALFFITLAFGAYFFIFARKLDAFLFGEAWVESFGVSFIQTQRISVILISILIGFCVSAVGMIGFIGLMVPHFVRRQIKSSLHYHLIPLSMLTGSMVLCFSDAIARSISDPHELPVGAVTALVGAPVFIFLLMRNRKGELFE